MVEMDNVDKLKRATEHSSRPQPEFDLGDYVYYWRVSKESEKYGVWKGPARIIGKIDNSKLWIAGGNKVLRCSPLQLQTVSEEHEAALRFVPPEALKPAGRGANKGARTFIVITKEGSPPSPPLAQSQPEQVAGDMEIDEEERADERMAGDEDHSEVNEESTKDESQSRSLDLDQALDMDVERTEADAPNAVMHKFVRAHQVSRRGPMVQFERNLTENDSE